MSIDITLVVGATGLLGSSIMKSVDVQEGSNTKLIGVTRKKEISGDFVVSDFSKDSEREILLKYSGGIKNIIHCAGFPSVFMSLRDPVNDHVNNFDPVLFSLELARKSGATLFYISTVEVYGALNCKNRVETSQTHPKSPYALNKLFSEEYIKLYHEIFGINYNILRPGVFIGNSIKKNIVFELLNSYQGNQKSVPIYVDLDSKLNFIHVDEITNAIKFLLENKIVNQIFNVGAETSLSVKDLIEWLEKKYGFIPEINQLDNEYQYKTAPINKLKDYGWEPKRDIYGYLDELIKIKL